MKYLINLIKRKKYMELFTAFFFIVIGIAGIFMINDNGIGVEQYNSNYTVTDGNPILMFLSRTNIGMVGIFLFVILLSFYYVRNSPNAQDEKEYTVELKDNIYYIKFRKFEFNIKKDELAQNKFYFHDKNGKFVSIMRANQIYSYIAEKYENKKIYKV